MNRSNFTRKDDDEVEINPRLKMRYLIVEEQLSKRFSKLGGLIARHPLYFTLIPVLLTAVLSTGLLYIKINRDFNYLLVETDGRAQQTKHLVQQRFPMNTSLFFDMPRVTMSSEFLMLMSTAIDEDSMFREEFFHEVKLLDEMVRNVTVRSNGESINYTDICGKRFGKCFSNDVLELAPHIKNIRSGKYKVHYPIYIDTFTFTYKEYIQAVGGVEVDDNGYLRDVKAIRLFYGLDVSNKSKTEAIQEWQVSVIRLMRQTRFERIHVLLTSEEFLKEEIKSYTTDMLRRAPVIVSVVVLFSFVSCMAADCVRSKQWLGPMSCVSAGLAIGSAIGFLCYIGVEYIDFCILLCYCVLTTEIDDAFILIASWRTTDPGGSVEERLRQVYSQSTVSITITSLTTVLSFSIGISSTVPAVRICCIYGASCCCFAYVYLLTFFGGCMALSGYREERRLHPFTFRHVQETQVNEDSTQYFSMSLISRAVENLLLHKYFKSLIAVMFLGILAAGVQGIISINFGSELSDGFSYDSPTRNAFEKNHKYFGRYTMPVQIIFDEYLNYADPLVQESVECILRNFSSYKHIAEPDMEMSWLKHFKVYQNLGAGKVMLSPFNLSDEADFVYALKHIFLKLPQTTPYRDDILFNEDETKILSSRFLMLMKDIDSPKTEIEAVKDLYKIASKAPMKVELFGLAFHILESSLNVPASTINLAAICCSLICMVFILFAPNIPYALCISAVVLCSITEVIGLVSFWDVKLDYVTLITFSYSIGLCINYPSHMTFAILIGRKNDQKHRKRNAFYVLAYPISQGCLSTVLGLISVVAHPHYISQSAFKMIFIISVISTLHGLFTIPVMLGLIGDAFKLISKWNSKGKMRRELTFETCLLTEGDNEEKL